MGRLLVAMAVVALATATSAAAALEPLRPDLREASQPRVRAGTIHIPAEQVRGMTRVIVRLKAPPLAAWASARSLSAATVSHHLDVRSASSRAYLARLTRLQTAAVAQVETAIPAATVQEHYSVILDGFAVSLPERKLPTLLRLSDVNKVYPSVGYFATDDSGPTVINAAALEAASGDAGEGIKIGVVDTGVDPTNPFLSSKGFSYPAGFPKGDTKLTTPKVIVARVFPGPIRNALSNKAFDNTEPHGTHVAGIAAGDAGTTAPAGPDHPETPGLSGVAPKAWIGNYRVFTIPTPLGDEADTPEIVEAFESAVVDGMNVINFSGGGPQTDPANDAMYEAVQNTVLAGVVPVIAAGNDREDFGYGTAGSPGSAPDAITVAAVSNSHVFAPALSVVGGPPNLGAVPIQGSGVKFPAAWSTLNQSVVDVGSIMGTNDKPVDPYLCGSASDPNSGVGTLPAGSLKGKIVLLLRGNCSFASKALRAERAGALGMIFVDNRPGEANPIPIILPLPAGMISDLDGKTLRAYMAQNGGQAQIRVSSGIEEIQTGRSGIITSFSSAGPTDFGYLLKPDIAAPGLDVLSSTPPRTTGSTFAVFAGTSMATPHVAGAAAILVERHPDWSPWQVKSALMSTAGPAWADTARTQEASVLLEGAGLANVGAADDPKIFTAPQSLSFQRIDVTHGAQVKSMLVLASDAGDGSGTWSVTVAPQTQTNGVEIDVTPQITITPGGDAAVPVIVHVAANAGLGENTGFIVLSGNGVSRRVPYSFLVERPALASVPSVPLQKLQTGNTAVGVSHVSQYCCPSAPFGQPPNYVGAPMNEDGSEHLYSVSINEPVVNFGVSILAATTGSLIDPFVLGSKDENDVQGYAGIPTDVNSLTYDSQIDIGAAGAQFPRQGTYYVSVDSRADPFNNKPLKGKYLLNAWINDVTPPSLKLLTTRVNAGRPLIVARVLDGGSGVDPLSLVFSYGGVLIGASAYDPLSGLAVFGLPDQAPRLKAGTATTIMEASDYQESKNIDTVGADLLPNTSFKENKVTVVDGPAATWLEPEANECALKHDQLVVAAGSTTKVQKVQFFDGTRLIGNAKLSPGGVYSVPWSTAGLPKGKHHLTVSVVDRSGRTAIVPRVLRVCG